MINKLFNYIKAYKKQNKEMAAYLKELNWANIYHDSIRGKKAIEELSLNIGGWAGNYSFFYVLHAVLSKSKPERVLEMGLGESSKFIATYLKNYLPQTKHYVLEHDKNWISFFGSSFEMGSNSEIVYAPLKNRKVNQEETVSYTIDEQLLNQKFNLYVVDGPFGSNRYSRFDIVDFARKFSKEDNFVIIYDDYHREGEKETVAQLLKIFENNKIPFHMNVFKGVKDVCLIVSEENRFLATV